MKTLAFALSALALGSLGACKRGVDVDRDGTIEVKTPEGAVATLGSNVASEFPLALPAGAQVMLNMKQETDQGMNYHVSAVADGKAKPIADSMEQQAKSKGFEVKRTETTMNELLMIALEIAGADGKGAVSVTDAGDGKVSITGQLEKARAVGK